jgi:hypothetical protein
MEIVKALARIISPVVDAEDAKVLATAFIVVGVVGLLMVVLAGSLGLAVSLFDALRGL